MLDFDSAQQLIIEKSKCINTTEQIELHKLNGRVLAENILAQLNVPPKDNSAMDGFAINYKDAPTLGASLPIQAPVYAGQVPEPLKSGHAMRIFTGSILPAGADTVVIQENCTKTDTHVTINTQVNRGDFVRYSGEDMAQGHEILQAGTRLNAGHVAMLAAQGLTSVKVYSKPKIGVLTTGDEIIQPGAKLPPAAIYDSNTSMLLSLCQNLGLTDITVKHVVDSLSDITTVIQELSSSCDLVLTVGGVSVGDKDFIKPAIANLGGNLDLWRVLMKPGKPVALADIGGSTLIGLPGNPVSAFVVFVLLASPFIRKLQGETRVLKPVKKAKILLNKPITNGARTDFIRVFLNHDGTIKPYHQQSSGAVSSLGWANALARLPVNTTINNGDILDIYEFSDHLG